MAHPKRALLFLLLLLLPLTALSQPAPLPLDENDLALSVAGENYALNTPAQPLLDALQKAGVKLTKTEAESCLFAGKDREYANDELVVGTLPKGDKGADVIETLMVLGGDYVTLRGISIGDTLDDVLKAYGEPPLWEQDEMIYTLTEDPFSPRLVFVLDGQEFVVTTFYMIFNTVQ